MRKILAILLLAALSTQPVLAEEYESSFGFSWKLPSHWLVLTRQEIRDNPDLFDFQNLDFEKANKDFINSVIQKVKSGSVEISFNQNTRNLQFADNINVIKQFGKIPKNNAAVPTLNQISAEFSKLIGRKIQVYTCELRKVNDMNTMYMNYDGMAPGTRTVQYIIQKSNSVQVIVTLTCKNSVLKKLNEEFEAIVSSIRMH
ncbi:MAG: hypothetical protein ACYSWR_05495 [Planctomycetota bacterium]